MRKKKYFFSLNFIPFIRRKDINEECVCLCFERKIEFINNKCIFIITKLVAISISETKIICVYIYIELIPFFLNFENKYCSVIFC